MADIDRFKMQTVPGLAIICDAIDITRKTTMIRIVKMNDVTTIKVLLPGGEREHLIVNKRSCGERLSLYVYFPASLTRSQHRYIYFKNKYGVDTSFKKFILAKLKKVICAWGSYKDAGLWCQNNLGGFKKEIESTWDSQLKLTSRKRQRSTTDVRISRASTTIGIPIRGLVPKGKVTVIRIRQSRNSSNAPFLRMTIPGMIFNDQRTRTRSLGTRFGIDDKWSLFVRQYVTAKVDGWETLDDAQQWILGSSFVVKMNRVWAMLLRHNLID